MPESQVKPVIINGHLEAVYSSFALVAGMQLDLFTPLVAGPLSLEQLAERLGVQAVKLRPLVYALAAGGLLAVDNGKFANTAEADQFLVKGKPTYMGGRSELTAANWRMVLNSAETIRNGEPPEIFDFHSQTQEELEMFFRNLHPGAMADGHRLRAQFDLSECRTFLDAGGGSGGLAIAVAQSYPELTATVLDLASVTPYTRSFVDASGVKDRVKVVAADAVGDRLTGAYEAAAARHVIQVLSEEDALALLKNLASVLRPGGSLYLIGWILDDSRIAPSKTVGTNLILLNTTRDGQAYTEGEYRRWLEEAGFIYFERQVMPDGVSFVRARRAAGASSSLGD